jgi:hypothetical protein
VLEPSFVPVKARRESRDLLADLVHITAQEVGDLFDRRRAAGVARFTVERFERGDAVRASTIERIQRALDEAGVIFIDANDGGPGRAAAQRLGNGLPRRCYVHHDRPDHRTEESRWLPQTLSAKTPHSHVLNARTRPR